jgi:archaellum component FlaC
MSKKNKIDQEYENLEKGIHKRADNEIKNIEKEVKKLRKEAEKVGVEIESSMAEKSVKSKNSSNSFKNLVSKRRK